MIPLYQVGEQYPVRVAMNALTCPTVDYLGAFTELVLLKDVEDNGDELVVAEKPHLEAQVRKNSASAADRLQPGNVHTLSFSLRSSASGSRESMNSRLCHPCFAP